MVDAEYAIQLDVPNGADASDEYIPSQENPSYDLKPHEEIMSGGRVSRRIEKM